jgi:Rab family protein
VLVGDVGVGKTHIVSRYIKDSLPNNPTATIGVELAMRTVTLRSGGTVKAQIWDTAGHERYRAITIAHFRRAVGAMIVYDVTNKNTFANAKRWMEVLREHGDPDIVIMLVGNKIDICNCNPASRKVSVKKATAFAKANRLLYEEISSITATRVKESFETLLEAIYKENSSRKVLFKPKSQPPLFLQQLVIGENSLINAAREKQSFEISPKTNNYEKLSANNSDETNFATKEDEASLEREIERLNSEQHFRRFEIENLTNDLRQKEEEMKALIDRLRFKEEEYKCKDQEIIDLKDKFQKLDEERKW